MKPWLILIFMVKPLVSAFEYSGSDVILQGSSESVVASDHLYSAYLINPASSAMVDKYQLGILYFQPFGLSGVHYGGLIGQVRAGNFGSGLTITSFGNELYQENQLVGNIARAFFNTRLSVGLNLRWKYLTVQNYFSSHQFGIDAGIQYFLHPGILMGFSIQNLNQPSRMQEENPLITRWGMAIRLGENFHTYFSFEKDSWFPASLRIGIEARVSRMLTLHSGMSSYPAVPSLGMTLRRNMVAIHYAFQYHFDLGGTHFWGISLRP